MKLAYFCDKNYKMEKIDLLLKIKHYTLSCAVLLKETTKQFNTAIKSVYRAMHRNVLLLYDLKETEI